MAALSNQRIFCKIENCETLVRMDAELEALRVERELEQHEIYLNLENEMKVRQQIARRELAHEYAEKMRRVLLKYGVTTKPIHVAVKAQRQH